MELSCRGRTRGRGTGLPGPFLPACSEPIRRLTTDVLAFPPARTPQMAGGWPRALNVREQPSSEPTNSRCRKPQMMCKKNCQGEEFSMPLLHN